MYEKKELLTIGMLTYCCHTLNAASRVLIDGFLPQSVGVGPTPANQPSASDPFRYFQIYLPDGYDQCPNKCYPVVYFLHGFGAKLYQL